MDKENMNEKEKTLNEVFNSYTATAKEEYKAGRYGLSDDDMIELAGEIAEFFGVKVAEKTMTNMINKMCNEKSTIFCEIDNNGEHFILTMPAYGSNDNSAAINYKTCADMALEKTGNKNSTILVPTCTNRHWTLKVLRKENGELKQVADIDSKLNGRQANDDNFSCGVHTMRAACELISMGYNQYIGKDAPKPAPLGTEVAAPTGPLDSSAGAVPVTIDDSQNPISNGSILFKAIKDNNGFEYNKEGKYCKVKDKDTFILNMSDEKDYESALRNRVNSIGRLEGAISEGNERKLIVLKKDGEFLTVKCVIVDNGNDMIELADDILKSYNNNIKEVLDYIKNLDSHLEFEYLKESFAKLPEFNETNYKGKNVKCLHNDKSKEFVVFLDHEKYNEFELKATCLIAKKKSKCEKGKIVEFRYEDNIITYYTFDEEKKEIHVSGINLLNSADPIKELLGDVESKEKSTKELLSNDHPEGGEEEYEESSKPEVSIEKEKAATGKSVLKSEGESKRGQGLTPVSMSPKNPISKGSTPSQETGFCHGM